MIVGDIDTGIQPGHPSFADAAARYIGEAYDPPAVWDGACQAGDGFAISRLQQQADRRPLLRRRLRACEDLDPKSHLSPRDDEGHGTHTASTAAGNYGVDP